MLQKYKTTGLAAAAYALLGMGNSKAAVTLTFEQSGPNVTATWSGTYDLPGEWEYPNGFGGGQTVISGGSAYALPVTYGFTTGAGVSSYIPEIVYTNGTYSGQPFGFNSDWLFGPPSAGVGAYEPIGTMTFANTTLADLGVAELSNTLAFTGSGNVDSNRQIFYTTIPEPSFAMLGMTGILTLVLRRRPAR